MVGFAPLYPPYMIVAGCHNAPLFID